MADERAPVVVGRDLVVAIDSDNGALVGETTTRLRGEASAEAYEFTDVPYDLENFYRFLAHTLQEGRQKGTGSTVVALHGNIRRRGVYDGAAAPNWLRDTPHVHDIEDPINIVSGIRAQGEEFDRLFQYRPLYEVVHYNTLVAHAAAAYNPSADAVAGIDLGRRNLTGGAVHRINKSWRAIDLPAPFHDIAHPDWPQLPDKPAVEQAPEQTPDTPSEIDPHQLALMAGRLGRASTAQVLIISWDTTGHGLKLDEDAYRTAVDELMASDTPLAGHVPETRFVHKQGPTDPHILLGGGGALLDSLLTRD
ncbi:MAG TPA: hypothetical protein VK694_01360 [Verrucomicrobiae bacterium]|nr:hypothetical protein [Verrucomicrobiae bacterium]